MFMSGGIAKVETITYSVGVTQDLGAVNDFDSDITDST